MENSAASATPATKALAMLTATKASASVERQLYREKSTLRPA